MSPRPLIVAAAVMAGLVWPGLGRSDGGAAISEADKERARVLVLLDLARSNDSDLQGRAVAFCAFFEEKHDPSEKAESELRNAEKRFVRGSSCTVDPDSGVLSADGKVGLALRIREVSGEADGSLRVIASYLEHGLNAADYEFRLRKSKKGWRIAARRRLSVA